MPTVQLNLTSDAFARLQIMAAEQRVSVEVLCEAILQFIKCPVERPAADASYDFYGIVRMNRFPANR